MRPPLAAALFGLYTHWNRRDIPLKNTQQYLLPRNTPLSTGVNSSISALECEPLRFPHHVQCDHVSDACQESQTLLHITYPQTYFCAAPAARPAVFTGLVIWLVFLFSFIGIAASDFFIPNLATIADVFGLDDNIAGVTFLAFGNGSPDLFSTLSAMRAGSGSLAIGELIGAASFIVSVVVGSMCIIKSFTVNPIPFLRDVGFFTLSMCVVFWILLDGLIEAWEAATLAGLYVCYVIVVAVSAWWENRRSRLDNNPSSTSREPLPNITIYVDDEPYQDDPGTIPPRPIARRPNSMPARVNHHLAASYPFPSNGSPQSSSPSDERPSHSRQASSASGSGHRPRLSLSSQRLQSFSLLGALEFRDVVNSLQRESAASVLDAFESPVNSPFAGGHYHFRSPSRTSSQDSIRIDHDDDVELDRSRPSQSHLPLPSPGLLDPGFAFPSPHVGIPRTQRSAPPTVRIPSSVAPSSISDEDDTTLAPPESTSAIQLPSSPSTLSIPLTKTHRNIWIRRARSIFHTLFPTLVDLRSKNGLARCAAILAAPAVFLLTITLPVVVTRREQEEVPADFKGPNVVVSPIVAGEVEDLVREGRLIGFEGETTPRPYNEDAERGPANGDGRLSAPPMRLSHSRMSLTSYASSDDDSEFDSRILTPGPPQTTLAEHHHHEHHGGSLPFNKYLTAVQLVIGPIFCISVAFIGMKNILHWLLIGFGTAGVILAILVLVYAKHGESGKKIGLPRILLCLMGFVVAMVWIMAIADEVVQVLNTFGLVFGLSDAIIGLTIFAVGNSLADFVANVTVARVAPIMGFSACFGGPMLNILLGIGLSGSFVIGQTGVSYPVEFGNTLLVSCVGLLFLLLATMIWVPWNGFHLDRKWGIFLVASYILIMSLNVVVEILTA